MADRKVPWRTQQMKRHMRKRRKCAVPSCPRLAKYVAPNDWCNIHWRMWWNWGVRARAHAVVGIPDDRPMPEWMKDRGK